MKKMLVLFIITSVAISCGNDDDLSFALQDISAPSNLDAIFDIAQDDSGEVSITPTGVGASVFQVFFGDVEGETAVEVAPGETITHTYGEGEFTLRIVGVGTTGLTSELSRVVMISFTPPTDLLVDIAVSDTNPFEITVSPAAENATVFDILFGDEEEGATPITIMSGETANHMYAEAGDYMVIVVARGAGSATIEVTETVTISGSAAPIVLPITFDDAAVNYAFVTFNGASYEVVDNPDLSGANTEASLVGAVTNSGAQFEGGSFNLGTPVDFSGENKTITMSFWSNTALPVLLKFEGGVNDERQTEVVAEHGGTGWEMLTFNFATDATKSFIDGNQGVGEAFVPTGAYATMVIFIDGPGTTAGTFFIDNIAQSTNVDSGNTTSSANVDDSAATEVSLPVGFESTSLTYTFVGFEGAESAIEMNPLTTGINPTSTVMRSTKTEGAQFFGGTFLDLEVPIDFSSTQTISIKTLSAKANIPIRVALENSAGGVDQIVVDVNTTVANEWEELTYDFSGVFDSGAVYNRIVVFFEFIDDLAGDGSTYYYDDVQLLGSTPNNDTGTTAAKTTFPVDFESPMGGAESQWNIFENDDNPALEIITNPDMSGANTSSTVAQFTARVGGQPFAGTETPLENSLTLDNTNSTVKVLVWKSVISDVGIKFSRADGGSTGEIKVANTLINQWEELTFDFSGVVGDPNNTGIEFLVVFPDFDTRTQDNVVLFDRITLSANMDTNTGGNTSTVMLLNGDFEAGAEPWNAGVEEFGAPPAAVVTENGNTFYSVMVDNPNPSEPFLVNLSQQGLSIVDGANYILSFDAWSDRDRTILAGIGESSGSFTGGPVNVSLTNQVQTITLNLTANGFGGDDIRVFFDSNAEAGLVNIDNVSLLEGGDGSDTP